MNENFDVTYGIGTLNILPATLTVKAKDTTVIFYSGTPTFTSTITGWQYDNNANNFLNGTKQPSYKITDASGNPVTVSPIPAGVYTITPYNLPLITDPSFVSSYNVVYVGGTLYVNPKGNGAKKLRTYLDCVQDLGPSSPFRYNAKFFCINDNATTIYVPKGVDNNISSSGKFEPSQQPVIFMPGKQDLMCLLMAKH